MKESKAVYVTKHKIRYDQNIIHQLFKSEKADTHYRRPSRNNFSCQYDCKLDNEICTCKNVITVKKQELRYLGLPKQVYAYRKSRSVIDIGVGSIKALQKRKVKRIYLPESVARGVGSSDLSSYICRKSRQQKISTLIAKSSYYDHKNTSSKCVGGILEYNTGCVINEKLSPIIQTKSGATSPKISIEFKNIEMGSNTVDMTLETIGTQFETEEKPEKVERKVTEAVAEPIGKKTEQTQKHTFSKETTEELKKPEVDKLKLKAGDKTYSSDSLVQHVHNLESPSDDKHSRTSFPDPMENKLEREYRKMFSPTKSKASKTSYDRTIPEFKSASILRRRFEALRRGLIKKDESSSKKKDSVLTNPSNQDNLPTHKDASVTSDPPSLIGRSFSNSKKYSPVVHSTEQYYDNRSPHHKQEKHSERFSQNPTESECQGVKGMFKLWGKKFNFEEDASIKRHATPLPSYNTIKKSEKEVKQKLDTEIKKESKKFSFFKKKSKDHNKEVYKPKKDVTAGRCEIRDGLTLKIGGATSLKDNVSKISEEGEEISRKEWIKKFLTSTIESARSVNVRWNNSMYATSSSTVFELLETVYKNSDAVFRSRSEITTEESSFYRSYTKHKVNFVQEIEAWMIPNTVPDRAIKEIPMKINSNKENKGRKVQLTISDQKRLIEKSEAFAHKIELVLHSNNITRVNNNDRVSSELLRINIPKDFFDPISSNESKCNQSSDEEVYKIVEYETNSEIRRGRKAIIDVQNSEQISNDIKVIVKLQESQKLESKILETVIKRPPTHRDVVIQGSNVNIPKRCDVIGVGIITQRDLREIRKPILKIQDDLTDDESEPVPQPKQKKCEFAESYLQEYYRHFTPFGFDYPWRASDSHLRSCSEKSVASFHNQGDGSKSCPNIYEDFQTATIITSGETSSACSQSANEAQCTKKTENFTDKFFKKFRKNPVKAKTEMDMTYKRILPKDSVEVFKKRKMYAASNKAQWIECYEADEQPVSIPSIESIGAQNSPLTECSKLGGTEEKPKKKKVFKKHVSLPDCETKDRLLGKQRPEGVVQLIGAECEDCNGKGFLSSKPAFIRPEAFCTNSPQPNKTTSEVQNLPPCSRPQTPSCHIVTECMPPDGTLVYTQPLLPLHCDLHLPERISSPEPPGMPPFCSPALSQCKISPQQSPSTPQKSCSSCCIKPLATPSRLKVPTLPSSTQCTHPPSFEISNLSREKLSNRVCNKPITLPCVECSTSPYAKPPFPPQAKPSTQPGRKAVSPSRNNNHLTPARTKPTSPSGPKPSTLLRPKPSSPPHNNHLPPPHPRSKPTPPACCTPSTLPRSKPCNDHSTPPPSRPKPTPPPVAKPSTQPRSKPSPPSSGDKHSCPCQGTSKTELVEEPKPQPNPQPSKSHPKAISPKCVCCDSCCKSSQNVLQAYSSTTSSCKATTCVGKSSSDSLESKISQSDQDIQPKQASSTSTNTGLSPRKCPSSHRKEPPKSSSLPPCEQCRAQFRSNISPQASEEQKLTQECLCPANSQISNPPSVKSDNSQTSHQVEHKRCKQTCARRKLGQECSHSSSKHVSSKKVKECRPDCANRQKLKAKSCPPTSVPKPKHKSKPISPPKYTTSRVSGVHLKMKPSQKQLDDRCETLSNVVRLCSHEVITIKLQNQTPSADEIRCPKVTKARDEDGRTLYERKDYCQGQQHHIQTSVLEDMYRDSKINRISTPIAITNNTHDEDQKDLTELKSNQSSNNLIEISFKICITNGEKSTELTVENENEDIKETKTNISKTNTDVFAVKNEAERVTEDVNPKNDVNIKITVRNLKQKPRKFDRKRCAEEFSKTISDKFHTVSTGYSDDAVELNDEHVFSIHRTTIDLSASVEKPQIKETQSKELTKNEPNLKVSTQSTELLQADVTEDEKIEEKSVTSKKNSQSEKFEESNTNDSELPDFNDTDDQDIALLGLNTSDECNDKRVVSKHTSKEEKKVLLKKVFQKAGKSQKNKESVRELRQMLKIILTDSSDNDDPNVTSNELVKDVTYASLKPNYFRDTDSMNNYYQLDSTFSFMKDSHINMAPLYPTEETSELGKSSDSEKNVTYKGCMCSKVAERLNNANMNISCCCRRKLGKDEETNCDLRDTEDFLLLNYKTAEYVDVETQNSKYLTNQMNSLNVSIHSKNQPLVSATEKVKLESIEIIMNPKDTTQKVLNTSSQSNLTRQQKQEPVLDPSVGLVDEGEVMEKDKLTALSTAVKKGDSKRGGVSDNGLQDLEMDILQSYEAKKAVLAIYAEKSEVGDHLVAKLPKFVSNRESEIVANCEQIATNSYQSVCTQNVVIMSVKR